MAAVVGKYAANKLLRKEMKKYKDKHPASGEVSLTASTIHALDTNAHLQDPYFVYLEDPRKPGKTRKVKKAIPAYIPEHDANVLAAVRRRSYRLDMCLFNFLGIRFGWEAVIGIIPAIGDAIGVFFALLVFKKCCSIEGGLDNTIKLRMLLNIALDFVVGLVPFVGDLADAAFKCNTRNLRLLEVTLDKKYKPGTRDDRDLAGVDREKRRKKRASGIFAPNDPPPATAFEEFSDDEVRGGSNEPSIQEPRPTYSGSRRERPNDRRDDRREVRQETGKVRR
jgi:hypothetical protein